MPEIQIAHIYPTWLTPEGKPPSRRPALIIALDEDLRSYVAAALTSNRSRVELDGGISVRQLGRLDRPSWIVPALYRVDEEDVNAEQDIAITRGGLARSIAEMLVSTGWPEDLVTVPYLRQYLTAAGVI